jgi:hypothetical protein
MQGIHLVLSSDWSIFVGTTKNVEQEASHQRQFETRYNHRKRQASESQIEQVICN